MANSMYYNVNSEAAYYHLNSQPTAMESDNVPVPASEVEDTTISFYWLIEHETEDDVNEADDAALRMKSGLQRTARFRPLNAFIYNHAIMYPGSSSAGATSAYTPGPIVEFNPSLIVYRWRTTVGYDVHALVKVVGGVRISELGLRGEILQALKEMANHYSSAYDKWTVTQLNEHEFLERHFEDETRARFVSKC